MKTQVEENHYDFNKYVNLKRWNSYYIQIREAMKLNPQKVLLIGIGDGIVANILKQQGVQVFTMDYDVSLDVDYVKDIKEVDTIKDHFDVVLCCQVLEHLPFSEFYATIEKLMCISSNLVLSLPIQHNRKLSIFKFQKLFWGEIKFSVPKYRKHFKFDGQHYWELNTKGYLRKSIVETLNKKYKVLNNFTLAENTYHHFFIIQKN